ncbi:MAG: hypothetical protein KatS3mg057_1472 [Herpetosiphonaceae bacterium]|nr:MAG: hypothetical protein KatS3mg057_1472 [Herpetosiphonaceae bacterium]
MPARSVFEYAIVRVVPRVEREEFINAGVIVFSRTLNFLGARVELDTRRLAALAPDLDVAAVQEQLQHIPLICAGGPAAGPLGLLPAAERFRWLVSPRSTVIQTSPVHSGICDDPHALLDKLMATMVRQPMNVG